MFFTKSEVLDFIREKYFSRKKSGGLGLGVEENKILRLVVCVDPVKPKHTVINTIPRKMLTLPKTLTRINSSDLVVKRKPRGINHQRESLIMTSI